MPKQSESRIILPQRVTQGQPVSAIWANQIREAIWRLTMRYGSDTQSPKPDYVHPFQIRAWYDSENEETHVQVAFGAFTANTYGEDGAGDYVANSTDYTVKVGSSTGDAIGLGADHPSLELASGDDYGIWVVATMTDSNVAVPGQGVWQFISINASPYLIASTTATTPTASGSLGVSGKYHAWFIGSVSVAANGMPLVSQHRKSDICHQGSIWFEPEPPEEEP
jgi:hypothetical protein